MVFSGSRMLFSGPPAPRSARPAPSARLDCQHHPVRDSVFCAGCKKIRTLRTKMLA